MNGGEEICLDNIRFRNGPCNISTEVKAIYKTGWNDWTNWSKCVCNNNESIQFRTRQCRIKSIENVQDCIGPSIENKPCNQLNTCNNYNNVRALSTILPKWTDSESLI